MRNSMLNDHKSVRCVIFDCDGTLVDSERLCIRAITEILARHEMVAEFAYIKENFQGVHIDDILTSFLKKYSLIDKLNIDTLVIQYRERCKELFAEHLQPIDGVFEVLDELNKRGVAFCIASNAPMEKMDVTLNNTKLMDYFEGRIYTGYDANAWKPDPDLLHYVMAQMNVTAQECLFIDDSVVGVRAGINAGVRTLYFAHDAQGRGDDIEHTLVTRVNELRECLDFC